MNKKKIEIYWVYPGEKQNSLIGKGGKGRIKLLILDTEENDPRCATELFYILKIRFFEPGLADENEFEITKEEKLAIFYIRRLSPTHDYSMQEEMVMPWLPGLSFLDLMGGDPLEKFNARKVNPGAASIDASSKQKLPIVFLLKIVINMLKELMHLIKRGRLHRDIKFDNFMIFFVMARLFDLGFAVNGTVKIDSRPMGTPGYMSPRSREVHDLGGEREYGYKYDLSSELYAFGVLMAEVFEFVSEDNWAKKSKIVNNKGWNALIDVPHELITPEEPEFKNHTQIPDEKDREKLLTVATRMLQIDTSEQQTSVEECLRPMEEVFDHVNKTACTDVGVMNVWEFHLAHQQDQQAPKRMLQAALNYPMIQFVQCGGALDDLNLMNIREIFAAGNFRLIGVNLLTVESYSQLPELLKSDANNISPGMQFKYHLITRNPLSQTDARKLRDDGLSVVVTDKSSPHVFREKPSPFSTQDSKLTQNHRHQ